MKSNDNKRIISRNVSISTYSFIISTVSLLIIGAVFLWLLHNGQTAKAWVVGGILLVITNLSLFYMPMSISVTHGYLCIDRSLWTRRIAIDDIENIELIQPTMAEKRIAGSGGWFGYWGWFSEPSIGKYFAYYGKASDCFLVQLRDGRKYMLGCKDPESIVRTVRGLMKAS